jgi:hypothetical protein
VAACGCAALMRLIARMLLCLLLAAAVSAADEPQEKQKQQKQQKEQDHDQDDEAQEKSAALVLTSAQREAVGVRTERPLPMKSAPPLEAYGTVLDPVTLASDLGRLESTRAAAAAASADAARQERLYHDDARASLKAWQAAQAQSVEAGAQERVAALTFSLQWGPLARWSAGQRQALLSALGCGQQLLMRADVPGPAPGAAIDPRALVELDGAHLSARVLGPLPRTDAQAQSGGWLLELPRAPAGFGPGARARVQLSLAAAARGLLVPATALVYGEEGAFVYREAGPEGSSFHYAAAAVKPLARIGGAWLVDGLDDDDRVVVQGAGVLWSLAGISSFSAEEEEHD